MTNTWTENEPSSAQGPAPAVPAPMRPTPTSAVEPPELALVDLGTCDYRKAWALQRALVGNLTDDRGRDQAPVQSPGQSTLILVEHPHVYTLGRRAKDRANVVAPGKVPVIQVERGGDVTYHGPGQLVAYPILKLVPTWQDVRRYVNALQQALIDTVAAFNIQAGPRRGEPGVWVVQDDAGQLVNVPDLDEQPGGPATARPPIVGEDAGSSAMQPLPAPSIDSSLPECHRWRKLASVGVAVSHWVTYHGVALNVSTDLSYFERIRPCGFDSATMTSMSRLLERKVSLEQVKPMLVKAMERRLGVTCFDHELSAP